MYCFDIAFIPVSATALNKLNGILSHAFRYSTLTPRVWYFLLNN